MKKTLSLIALMILFAQGVSAAMISFSSGPFGTNFSILATPSGNMSGGLPTAVTGLSQFDPSLGTLTGVSFSINPGTFGWGADLNGNPSGMDYEVAFESSIQGDLAYFNGSNNLVTFTVADSIDLSCQGGGGFCFDSNGNFFDYASDGFAIARPLTDFNLVDLVGTGDVANLSLSIGMFMTSFLIVDGVPDAEVFGSADISDATVNVTYEYTAIPVPAAMWLFGSALGLLGWMRRKAA